MYKFFFIVLVMAMLATAVMECRYKAKVEQQLNYKPVPDSINHFPATAD